MYTEITREEAVVMALLGADIYGWWIKPTERTLWSAGEGPWRCSMPGAVASGPWAVCLFFMKEEGDVSGSGDNGTS